MNIWISIGLAILTGVIGFNAGEWIQHDRDLRAMKTVKDLIPEMVSELDKKDPIYRKKAE